MMEEVDTMAIRPPPKDKYFATYSIMVLLGCGFLFPYNSFITAVDYFSYLYPNYNVEFAFPAVYTISLLATMGLMVKWGRSYSFATRIVGSFICFLVTMIAVPVADLAMGENKEKSNEVLFYGTCGLLLITGIADAIVQGSMYGLAGLFPPLYRQSIQNGNGVAGLVVSLLRVLTKASVPDDTRGLRFSSLLYFVLSAVTMLACIVGYFVLVRLPFTKHYLMSPVGSTQDIELSMLTEAAPGSPGDNSEPKSEDRPIPIINVKMVIYRTWKIGAAVGFVFFITLLGFPGLMTSIPSSRISADWYPIILITVFNLFDFLGKMSPAFIHDHDWTVPKKEMGLLIACGCRVIFIVIFATSVHFPNAQHEAYVITVVALFAYSGGFLGAVLMMVGPSKVSPPEKEVAGTVSAFFLVMGLAVGAGASWSIEQFVKW